MQSLAEEIKTKQYKYKGIKSNTKYSTNQIQYKQSDQYKT